MNLAPTPDDEVARLVALRKYEILDTPSEAEFDDLAELASLICGTPIALMTLLDVERQWFKANVGLDAEQTPRDISFCGHAIAQVDIFEVPNAQEDPRFHDNPLVTGAPGIRFYAGAPLITDEGFRLGTLCVIDRVPRVLDDTQRKALAALSRQVVRQIENRAIARELMQVQSSLKQSQAFLTTLIDTLPVAVYTKSFRPGKEGQLVLWNKASEKITGYSSAQVQGRTNRQIFPHDVALQHEAHDAEIIATGRPVEVPKYRITRPDGTTRVLRTVSVPMFASDGKIDHVLGVSEDITVATQQQSELANKQAELLAVSDSSPLGMFRTNAELNVTYINPMYETITGMSLDAATGERWLERVHPDDRERVRTNRKASAGALTGYAHTLRYLKADGTAALCKVLGTPIVINDKFTGFVGTVEDITEHTRISDALMQSEKRLRLITDALPALISYVDHEQRYRFNNRAYYEVTGIKPDQIIGMTIREVFGEGNYVAMSAQINAALAGEFVSSERKIVKDGKTTYFQCEYVPERAANGQVTGFYVMAIDVTARCLAERKLAASERRLTAITNNIPALVAHIDTDKRYLFVNSQIGTAFGKDPAKMIGRSMAQEHPPELYAFLQPFIEKALAGENVTFEGKARAFGTDRYFQSTYVPEIDVKSKVSGFFAMTFDITETKNSELAQAAAQKRLRTITDNLPVLITYIDSERMLRFANGTMKNWMGITPEQAVDRPFAEVFGPTIYAERKQYIDRVLAGERVEFEIVSLVENVTRHMQAIYLPDTRADGTVQGFYTLTNDVSVLKASEQRLAVLARTDSLTGLPNRYQLNETLANAVARQNRSGRMIAVLYLDIDHFKQINDSLGHAAGDAILVEFAKRLVATVRVTDTVARLAGDEFVIVLEGLQAAEESVGVAKKILAAMAAPFVCASITRQVGTSIGVAYAQGLGETPDQLLERGDKGLYLAKAKGRSCYAEV